MSVFCINFLSSTERDSSRFRFILHLIYFIRVKFLQHIRNTHINTINISISLALKQNRKMNKNSRKLFAVCRVQWKIIVTKIHLTSLKGNSEKNCIYKKKK